MTKKPDTALASPIWQRGHGESDPAYGAFTRYLNMGTDRSLAKVGEELGKSTSLMERWSSDWHWRLRVEAYDEDQQVTRILANNEAIESMAKRHAQQAGAAIQAMMLPHLALAQKLRDTPDLVKSLSEARLDDLINLASRTAPAIVSLMQAERLARGEPTDIRYTRTESVSVELSTGITEDEYREVVRVLNEAGWLNGTDEPRDSSIDAASADAD